MEIKLIVVGKTKSSELVRLINEYVKRINFYKKFKIIVVNSLKSKKNSEKEIKKIEGENVLKNIKKNIDGISNISSERLIDELKKITSSNGFLKLFKDKESLELIEIIFPQLKNIKNFKKQNSYAVENFLKIDFIFLIALLVIDGTDNADYFLYKFKISNKDKKRLKLIDLFYREKVTLNNFTEKNLNKFFYFNGRQAVLDIINFKIFISNKVEKKLIKLLDTYKEKVIPTLPIGADLLMSKFQIPEGKTLGNKLKRIEETWVQNGFQISDKQVQQIVKS